MTVYVVGGEAASLCMFMLLLIAIFQFSLRYEQQNDKFNLVMVGLGSVRSYKFRLSKCARYFKQGFI